MIGDIYQFEDLQKLTERKTVHAVIARLNELEIKFHRFGRGKPWTTLQQINAAFDKKKPQRRHSQNPDDMIITVK